MERLCSHIEALLQSGECAILPGFGGFIARPVPAYYAEDEHLFFPPRRTVAFSGQLTMNDGLLTQRYMQDAGMDYADATQVVEHMVDRLRDKLAIEGSVELPGVGCLYQDYAGLIRFEGEEAGVASPSLFGLDALAIRDLSALSEKPAQPATKVITSSERTIDIHIGRRALHAVATAAAVALLLIVSILPANDGKYTDIASLGIVPEKTVVAQPLAEDTAVAEPAVEPEETTAAESAAASATLEEATAACVVGPEVAETATAVETPAPVVPSRIYHVIVGSLPSRRGADEMIQKYIASGFPQASLVESDERVRVSLVSFTDKAEGEAYVSELRQRTEYKNVWLLSVRNR